MGSSQLLRINQSGRSPYHIFLSSLCFPPTQTQSLPPPPPDLDSFPLSSSHTNFEYEFFLIMLVRKVVRLSYWRSRIMKSHLHFRAELGKDRGKVSWVYERMVSCERDEMMNPFMRRCGLSALLSGFFSRVVLLINLVLELSNSSSASNLGTQQFLAWIESSQVYSETNL